MDLLRRCGMGGDLRATRCHVEARCDRRACNLAEHYCDCEAVEYVPAPARGAVSAEDHTRAAQALDRFAREKWGWGSKEWPDVVDAVAIVVNALSDHPRGAVDVSERSRIEAEALELFRTVLEDDDQHIEDALGAAVQLAIRRTTVGGEA